MDLMNLSFFISPSALLLRPCYGLNDLVIFISMSALLLRPCYGLNDLVIFYKPVGFITSSMLWT